MTNDPRMALNRLEEVAQIIEAGDTRTYQFTRLREIVNDLKAYILPSREHFNISEVSSITGISTTRLSDHSPPTHKIGKRRYYTAEEVERLKLHPPAWAMRDKQINPFANPPGGIITKPMLCRMLGVQRPTVDHHLLMGVFPQPTILWKGLKCWSSEEADKIRANYKKVGQNRGRKPTKKTTE